MKKQHIHSSKTECIVSQLCMACLALRFSVVASPCLSRSIHSVLRCTGEAIDGSKSKDCYGSADPKDREMHTLSSPIPIKMSRVLWLGHADGCEK